MRRLLIFGVVIAALDFLPFVAAALITVGALDTLGSAQDVEVVGDWPTSPS